MQVDPFTCTSRSYYSDPGCRWRFTYLIRLLWFRKLPSVWQAVITHRIQSHLFAALKTQAQLLKHLSMNLMSFMVPYFHCFHSKLKGRYIPELRWCLSDQILESKRSTTLHLGTDTALVLTIWLLSSKIDKLLSSKIEFFLSSEHLRGKTFVTTIYP